MNIEGVPSFPDAKNVCMFFIKIFILWGLSFKLSTRDKPSPYSDEAHCTHRRARHRAAPDRTRTRNRARSTNSAARSCSVTLKCVQTAVLYLVVYICRSWSRHYKVVGPGSANRGGGPGTCYAIVFAKVRLRLMLRLYGLRNAYSCNM